MKSWVLLVLEGMMKQALESEKISCLFGVENCNIDMMGASSR
jgi:hypothetical protein